MNENDERIKVLEEKLVEIEKKDKKNETDTSIEKQECYEKIEQLENEMKKIYSLIGGKETKISNL